MYCIVRKKGSSVEKREEGEGEGEGRGGEGRGERGKRYGDRVACLLHSLHSQRERQCKEMETRHTDPLEWVYPITRTLLEWNIWIACYGSPRERIKECIL